MAATGRTRIGPAERNRRLGARLSRGHEVFAALTSARLRETREFTVTGIAKWLLDPVSYMFVYFLLVGVGLRNATRVEAYLLFLFSALVPWRYFVGVVNGAMGLVQGHRAIVTNRIFPRELLPLVGMATEGATFGVALVLFIPLMAYYGIAPTPAVLWLPVAIGILGLITVGPAYLMTLFGLYLPGYRGAMQNVIRMGFFVSTALIGSEQVPPKIRILLEANPMSEVFELFRAVFLYGRAPEAFDVLYPTCVGVVVLLVAIAWYRRRQHDFAKEV